MKYYLKSEYTTGTEFYTFLNFKDGIIIKVEQYNIEIEPLKDADDMLYQLYYLLGERKGEHISREEFEDAYKHFANKLNQLSKTI